MRTTPPRSPRPQIHQWGGGLNDLPAQNVGDESDSKPADNATAKPTSDAGSQPTDAAKPTSDAGSQPTDAAKQADNSAAPSSISNEAPSANDTPNTNNAAEAPSSTEAPQKSPLTYADWRAIASAVEAGTIDGEGVKPSGAGTTEDPYTLSTPEAFAWWALLHADTTARLEADLDLTQREGAPLPWPGDATLTAELDGQGHTLVFATRGAGLFAEVDVSGAVRWLTLGRSDADAKAAADAHKPAAEIASEGTRAGSVAGTNKGTIEGVVNHTSVGFAVNTPTAAPADTTSDTERFAGGIVAQNDGTIRDCANLGAVANNASAGNSAAAGIAAKGSGTIATSYNAADVHAAQNAAYIVTLLDAEVDYASIVDEATSYLAPGDATYEGVSDADKNRPGALAAQDLKAASERLNTTREGEAAVWAAGTEATSNFPAPSKPANPDAANALSATNTIYADWGAVGAVQKEENLKRTEAIIGTDGYGTMGAVHDAPPAADDTWVPALEGDGSEAKPFIVRTPEAFAWFASKVNDGTLTTAANQNIKLAANLDLAGSAHTGQTSIDADFDACLPWMPIAGGVADMDFYGTFDGGGKAVRNLYVNLPSTKYVGLIGFVWSGVVKNIDVVSGHVTGLNMVGGVVGCAHGVVKVSDCQNAVSVERVGTGSGGAGGIVGGNYFDEGSEIFHVEIARCSNSGSITAPLADGGEAGGIAGTVPGFSTIDDCYNRGAVSGGERRGGILGLGGGSDTPEANYAQVSNCYNADTLAGNPTRANSAIAAQNSNVTNCYTLKVTTERPLGMTGEYPKELTPDKLKSWDAATKLNNGRTGTNAVWTQSAAINDGYPRLGLADWAAVGANQSENELKRTGAIIGTDGYGTMGTVHTAPPASGEMWLAALAGDGSVATPYVVRTPEALAWFASKVNDGTLAATNQNIKLAANLDLSGSTYTGAIDTGTNFDACLPWVPIGSGGSVKGAVTGTFSGTLDGDSHMVSHLFTGSLAKAAGFIGTLRGTLKGINIVASNITGTTGAGGVVGMAGKDALIERCSAAEDVSVSSTAYSGGLAGLLSQSASVMDCWTRAKVDGGGTCGGFVGSLEGTAKLSSCYAAASSVVGSGAKGSFAATVNTTVTVERCYFQKASDLPAVQGGTPSKKFTEKTALQMASPFLAFQLNNNRTGADAVWTQVTTINEGYPTLGAAATSMTWGEVGFAQSGDELKRTEAIIDTDGYGTSGDVCDAPPTADNTWVPALAGMGTTSDPYVVRTPEAFAWFAYKVNSSLAATNQNITLAANLDLSGSTYTGATITDANFDACLPWMPIGGGGSGERFQATFDGGGKAVKNLYVNMPNIWNVGLIGTADDKAVVKNANVASGHVSGQGCVGGLVGYVDGKVSVTDSQNAASVVSAGPDGYQYAGGIVGGNFDEGSEISHVEIARCSNSGPVTAPSVADTSVGGIVGWAPGYSKIDDCYNRGEVSGGDMQGGIVGVGGTSATPAGNYTQVSNCYNAGTLAGNAATANSAIAASYANLTNCYTLAVVPGNPETSVTGAPILFTKSELKSWSTAYALNNNSYVGKKNDDGTTVSSTVWTDNPPASDGTWTHGNEGYPVFGDLNLKELVVTLDSNDVLKPLSPDSTEPTKKATGSFTTLLHEEHPLRGLVTLIKAPAADSAEVTLVSSMEVDTGFSTWGTAHANSKVALVADDTSLLPTTEANIALSSNGLAALDLHAAAAYDAQVLRTVTFAVMDATAGYEVTVTVKPVTKKTLDVNVPVETGSSFELAPDGKLHENVMAKTTSTLQVNNSVPIAGQVSSVTPLEVTPLVQGSNNATATINAVLLPVAEPLAASTAPITGDNKVRLLVGASTNTGTTAGLTPLTAPLYYDPTKNTVPLSFAVPGNKQAVWKWGMDYTGTFLEPSGVFGYSIGYSFNLPSNDVSDATLAEKG